MRLGVSPRVLLRSVLTAPRFAVSICGLGGKKRILLEKKRNCVFFLKGGKRMINKKTRVIPGFRIRLANTQRMEFIALFRFVFTFLRLYENVFRDAGPTWGGSTYPWSFRFSSARASAFPLPELMDDLRRGRPCLPRPRLFFFYPLACHVP